MARDGLLLPLGSYLLGLEVQLPGDHTCVCVSTQTTLSRYFFCSFPAPFFWIKSIQNSSHLNIVILSMDVIHIYQCRTFLVI